MIALVSKSSKVLRVILDRIQSKLAYESAQEKASFGSERGTMDQITNLGIILEKFKNENKRFFDVSSISPTP